MADVPTVQVIGLAVEATTEGVAKAVSADLGKTYRGGDEAAGLINSLQVLNEVYTT